MAAPSSVWKSPASGKPPRSPCAHGPRTALRNDRVRLVQHRALRRVPPRARLGISGERAEAIDVGHVTRKIELARAVVVARLAARLIAPATVAHAVARWWW